MAGKSPLIVILGPTATGKTQLAIALVQALNGEIIGADSRQIYRFMDIGTAKPTLSQRQQIPHHLVDVVDPDENLGLAQYQRLAYDTIADIHQRDKLPLLVGGTGQYITAVVEGWSIPEVPPNYPLREELEAFAAAQGSEALHLRLQQADPQAAQATHHRNVRRVVRALEVFIETGIPISTLQQKQPPPYRIHQLGLEMERQQLYDRADQRVDQMMTAGFLQEVSKLLEMNYNRTLPSMSGLGYKELVTHLVDDLPLDEAVANTKTATHDFIRRQYTWFHGHDTGIRWHDVETLDTDKIIVECQRWLEAEH